MTLHVGTSGWAYKEWKPDFYPEKLPQTRWLDHYTHELTACEINSSFYRVPAPATAASWAERTPSSFEFSLKLYQKFTHPKMFEEASGEERQLSDEDFDTARQGLEPLASSGKLGGLLAQFPPSFKADEASLEYLEELIRRLDQYPLAVELRHRSWSDSPEARRLLEEQGVAWVMIDEPKFRTSIRDVPLTSRLGYFRFHGRNYEEWWRGDRETRYNYLYTAPEQAELAGEVEEVADRTAETYVFYNNHYKAKAVVNATQLKQELGQPVGVGFTPEMFAEYPELKDVVGVGAADGTRT
jgi:uncharacterized protein YecE (DUF72 family)